MFLLENNNNNKYNKKYTSYHKYDKDHNRQYLLKHLGKLSNSYRR